MSKRSQRAIRRTIGPHGFVPVAALVAAAALESCGGCYLTSQTTDITVSPATACLTVTPGANITNGCSRAMSGVLVTNGCSENLTLPGGVTIAAGAAQTAYEGAMCTRPTGPGAVSCTGTLGTNAVTISWTESRIP